MAQWLRICLQIQGTWVPSLVQEDSTYRGASKPEYHNYWASNLQAMLHNKTSHCNERPVVDSAQTAWPPPPHECSLGGRRKPTRLLLCTLGCSVVVFTSMEIGGGVALLSVPLPIRCRRLLYSPN